MNNTNPLIPQGALPQPSRGKSTVRIIVFAIVAMHAVFFAGLLMQGCKPDDGTKSSTGNKTSDTGGTLSELAKLDTNYYQAVPEMTTSANPAATPLTNAGGGFQTQTTPLPPGPIAQAPIEPAPAPTPTETKEYTIVKNDTLAKIAKAQHVTVGEISKANPGLDPKKLMVGKKIQVPVSTASSSGGGIGFAEPSKPESGVGSSSAFHQVKAGETLTKIARQHGVSVKALRAANGLKTDRLLVGQKLKVPASSSTSAATTGMSEPSINQSGGTTTLSATNPAGNSTVR